MKKYNGFCNRGCYDGADDMDGDGPMIFVTMLVIMIAAVVAMFTGIPA